ncbi:hypothetical protein [Gymnodinialimonas ceratoperidinii]|uniref:Uncharacterized protein n=1 Tax=Gymnodinialimonas ceratoperidinii TaxID=2856823 RepID=A0A8F6Y8N6_9RHOB|nr:hypothetical protein [Gymnodinialimonas ceratoperidinii]QXT38094.1 hypothetical protein KYE46_08980 [Gymnodinialimonas ceratoperidinii]
MGWPRVLLWGAAREVIWVTFYLGLSDPFGDRIDARAILLGNASDFLVADLDTVGLGAALLTRIRQAN